MRCLIPPKHNSRTALTQLTLRSSRRPTLHPLPTSDKLLPLRNIMQIPTPNWLPRMPLRLRSRAPLHRLRLARKLALSLRNAGDSRRVEDTGVLLISLRLLRSSSLGRRRRRGLAGRESGRPTRHRTRLCDAFLALGDIGHDLAGQRLVGVLLGLRCGASFYGVGLARELRFSMGDVRDCL